MADMIHYVLQTVVTPILQWGSASWQLSACVQYWYQVYDSACFVTDIADLNTHNKLIF